MITFSQARVLKINKRNDPLAHHLLTTFVTRRDDIWALIPFAILVDERANLVVRSIQLPEEQGDIVVG